MSTLAANQAGTSVQDAWLQIVKAKVEAMRFGSVQIIVHEGRVTQVESTEKTRLSNSGSSGSLNGDGQPSRVSFRA